MGKGTHLGEFEEIVLLAVAGLSGAAHGAAIHTHILEATGRDVSIPSVYVTLARLEKKGYVTTAVDRGGEARGGRLRKLFAVTEAAVRDLSASRLVHDRLWAGLDFDPLTVGDAS